MLDMDDPDHDYEDEAWVTGPAQVDYAASDRLTDFIENIMTDDLEREIHPTRDLEGFKHWTKPDKAPRPQKKARLDVVDQSSDDSDEGGVDSTPRP